MEHAQIQSVVERAFEERDAITPKTGGEVREAVEAALDALENCEADVREMTTQYDRRRKFVLSRFADMGIDCFEAKGAFYAFPECPTGDAEEFAEQLIKEESVAVVPGDADGDAYVPVSVLFDSALPVRLMSRCHIAPPERGGRVERPIRSTPPAPTALASVPLAFRAFSVLPVCHGSIDQYIYHRASAGVEPADTPVAGRGCGSQGRDTAGCCRSDSGDSPPDG